MHSPPNSEESFYSLAESLPAGTDLKNLQRELERRWITSRAQMSLAELRLLDALQLRQRCIRIPFYAKCDAEDPQWWIDFKGSALAATPKDPVPFDDDLPPDGTQGN